LRWGQNHRAPAIPKFGTWDVTNPNSGEGYTAIFTKIKEERQIKSTNITNTPPLHKSNIENQYAGSFSWLSKVMLYNITSYMLYSPNFFSSSFFFYSQTILIKKQDVGAENKIKEMKISLIPRIIQKYIYHSQSNSEK